MKKVLIANRGEIAVRIIRACRELGLKTVAIHSTVDKDSLHTKLADESVCIGPGPSVKSYLHIPSVMSAAELTGVDAIHPGYGFLSENAEFAKVCADYGITFIGPTPDQIRVMGDKVSARNIAIKSNVSLLPGSTDKLDNVDDALALAREIGFPVIIKASAGGGGRGMKIVWEERDFVKMYGIAKSEAKAGFNDDSVFVEKYLVSPRHVEVQLIGDRFGNIFHLGERDCSIQRRHQKIVEEAPCPLLSEDERKTVTDMAISFAKSVNYQSLGTVEFLYEKGKFYFMEMNTRVQVEHPVTEEVMSRDLVKDQIRIAQGESIAHLANTSRVAHGHALECRINAEHPETFAPCPGLVETYHEPGGPGIRVDSMIYAGYRVPALYDSMLAKLIAWGSDREESIQRMKRALLEYRIGGISTNIPFHLKILDHPDFISSHFSTNFVEKLQQVKSH